MRILAFDTATSATTVALSAPGREPVELRDDPPPGQRPRHANQLLALISRLLNEARVSWQDIDRIAVGVGPGTFTGLRIGVATAKGLGQATGTPLVAVSTLHALALNARLDPEMPQAGRAILAVLDARRGEAFAAAWDSRQLGASDPPLLSPAALGPEALEEALRGLPSPLAIGGGAIAFRAVLERSGARVPDDASELHLLTAAGHCLLARDLPVSQPDELVPDYQRPPDVKPRTPG